MDEYLDEAAMATVKDKGGFEGEIFLSTDGKNTVHIKSDTPEGRAHGWEWAKRVYDEIKGQYGTKQQLNKETYQASSADVDTNSPSYCPIHKTMMKKYEKDGRSWYSHMVSEGNWCNGKTK